MKNLILILLIAASLSLSCARPQKFEAKLPTNTDNNQINSEVSATPTDALIFIISEEYKVFLQKNGKKELLGTTSEAEKLRQIFTDLLKEKADKTVFVKAPRSVKYSEVKAVVEILRSTDAKPIGLAIEGLEQ